MPKTTRPTYRYRVTYQRQGWGHSQSKQYTRHSDAVAFCWKLRGDDRLDLAPLAVLEMARQEVGPWETIQVP